MSSADESVLGLVLRAELAELETSQHQPGTLGASAQDVASCITSRQGLELTLLFLSRRSSQHIGALGMRRAGVSYSTAAGVGPELSAPAEAAPAAPSPSPPKENKAGETSHRCALSPGLTQPLSFSSPQPCCRAPRLGVYAGTGTPPSLPVGPGSLAPGPPALPRSPSPTSVAPDSTKREREREGAGPGPFPSSSGRSRAAALSLGRFLKKGCWTSPIFATLSPKRPAVPHGKVQPLGEGERRLRPDAKAVSSFFQIKMDAPLESRIYPIDSEEGEDNCHQACKDSAKEVICPWEKPTEEGRAG
ncbi:uncharacterized protein LOC141932999 [Strix aluco]|uniref:uncharacterized protein LOC141932999 n=1 Tax=Strix aluco TaxID=111821 RepID=UPI003DA4C16A